MQEIVSNSLEQTQKIANDFAKKVAFGDVICLYGNLGSGKTTFAKYFAAALGIKTRIISPTFVIVRRYKLGENTMFYHADLYRLQGESDLESTGLLEVMGQPSTIVAIEWPEKMGALLPKKRWELTFAYIDENTRKITIERIDSL